MTVTRWSARATALITAVVLSGAMTPTWSAEAADTPTTAAYTTPGSYDWTVPANVRRVTLDVVGGRGGGRNSTTTGYGRGNRIVATMRVVPGSVLHLHVGSNGGPQAAGSNGGGGVGQYAGGGGGASDIRIGGDTLADRVLVAAGGGGEGAFGAAGDAGQPGNTPVNCSPARPGTSTAGGVAAPQCEGTNAGGNGGLGVGGAGASTTGGGGGGGYYGGAGGGDFGGGAGGSSLVPAGATAVTNAVTSLPPSVSLAYVVSRPDTVAVSTTATTLPADDGVSTTTVTATVLDQIGIPYPGDAVTFASDDPAVEFGPVSNGGEGVYQAQVSSSNTSGNVTITATDSSGPALKGTSQLAMTALPQTVQFAAPAPVGLVVGQELTAQASGGASGSAITYGVAATTSGFGTPAAACSISGATVFLEHPGSCVLTADQAGNAQYSAAPTASQMLAVGQAATTTSLSVTASQLSAVVAPTAPGAGSPGGTVTFAVDGADIGTAPVNAGAATLTYALDASGPHQATAVYSGSDDFTGSSTSTSRTNPTITAQLVSSAPKTSGWFRAPVQVSFTCTPAGAAITSPCPVPVTLSANGAGQSVTRTIEAADGGVATVVASGINIDRVAPRAQVTSARDGATYMGAAPPARCAAVDVLSGPSRCAVGLTRAGQTVTFVATATDVAGNVGRTTGSYRVLTTYLRGVAYRDGRFQVRAGRRYTIVTSTADNNPPRFLGRVAKGPSTKTGRKFHAVRSSHGTHHWAIKVRVRSGLVGSQRFYVLRVDGTRQPISLSVAPRRR